MASISNNNNHKNDCQEQKTTSISKIVKSTTQMLQNTDDNDRNGGGATNASPHAAAAAAGPVNLRVGSGRFLIMKQRITAALSKKKTKKQCLQCNSNEFSSNQRGIDNYGAANSLSSTADDFHPKSAIVCDENAIGSEQALVLKKEPSHRRSFLRRQRLSTTRLSSSFSAPG